MDRAKFIKAILAGLGASLILGALNLSSLAM